MRSEPLPWFFSVISVVSVVKKFCYRIDEKLHLWSPARTP